MMSGQAKSKAIDSKLRSSDETMILLSMVLRYYEEWLKRNSGIEDTWLVRQMLEMKDITRGLIQYLREESMITIVKLVQARPKRIAKMREGIFRITRQYLNENNRIESVLDSPTHHFSGVLLPEFEEVDE